MAFITIYSNNTLLTAFGSEFQYDSDILLDYIVTGPSFGTYYKVYKKGHLVAEVNWGEMIFSGKRVRKKNNNMEWVLSEQPEKVISISEDDTYLVNGELAAKVTRGGELFPYLYKLITQLKWSSFNPYLTIEFDEKKLTPFLAICILVTELSEIHS